MEGTAGLGSGRVLSVRRLHESQGQTKRIGVLAAAGRTTNQFQERIYVDFRTRSGGEFPVAVSLYQHRVDEYLDKGAPIQWVAPDPLVGGDPNKIALLKNRPRPNAAKIFIDFMLSVEGQKLLQDKGRSPGRIGLSPKNPRLKEAKIFTFHVSPSEYEALGKEFNKIFKVQ